MLPLQNRSYLLIARDMQIVFRGILPGEVDYLDCDGFEIAGAQHSWSVREGGERDSQPLGKGISARYHQTPHPIDEWGRWPRGAHHSGRYLGQDLICISNVYPRITILPITACIHSIRHIVDRNPCVDHFFLTNFSLTELGMVRSTSSTFFTSISITFSLFRS